MALPANKDEREKNGELFFVGDMLEYDCYVYGRHDWGEDDYVIGLQQCRHCFRTRSTEQ